MAPRSIASVNQLPQPVKEALYTRFIPDVLLRQFDIPDDFRDSQGRRLLDLRCASGATDVVLAVRRSLSDPDPLLYVHLTDTVMGQIHILLYVVNDPDSPRFDVDRMPDGSPTQFGSLHRNLPAEEAACRAGLAPGQVHRGLRALKAFDRCLRGVRRLPGAGHVSRRAPVLPQRHLVRALRIQLPAGSHSAWRNSTRLSPQADPLVPLLDNSTPFRRPAFASSIRGRSWAIHDGILGRPHVPNHDVQDRRSACAASPPAARRIGSRCA